MRTWDELQRAGNHAILTWAETRPWARAMANCDQDEQWHSEGDVWTHTRMVCAELERLPEWPALGRAAQLKLLLVALFHDAGKPATTVLDETTGRTRSPKHSLVSAVIARDVLRELGCKLATREEIVAMARYHGRPPYLLEKANPEREVISLSWRLNNRLLYLFTLADTRGRDTREMNRPEENLHLWRLLAEEQGCFEKPYAFANDHARFLFYREELTSLHYVPRADYRCTVTMISGLPGAGKDTWLARWQPAAPVIALDELRAELDVDPTDNQGTVIQAARERCREHLRAGQDFAFNATNLTRQIRQRWIDLFADYSARVEIVYQEPPLATIRKRNRQRDAAVPEGVWTRMLEKLEPPDITECHGLRFVEE